LPALTIVHQAGARNLEQTREAYAAAGVTERVEVVPFLDDVAGAMAESHLLISRAGAITLAEICAAGRPSVLLPLTIAQGHQMDNARLLADAGAAEVISAGDLAPEPLEDRLGRLLGDRDALARMGHAARDLAKPRAVAEIADRLESIARAGGVH
jgi:UDP-N-acetylglucosamine--N-acetylmuramyl-(pentapeptide) pyrophosphoryl-undecaprenol N-acetylglucosamine transferase